MIDAVGHPTAFEGAIDTVRRGGTVVVLGRLLVGDDGAPARRVLVASAHAPVRGAHARGVVVGPGDGRTGARRGGPDATDQPSTTARGSGRGLRAVRPPGSHQGGPRAVIVTVVGREPSGLASMVADLIEQNLARDPDTAGSPSKVGRGARCARCRRDGLPPDRTRGCPGRRRRRSRCAPADPLRLGAAARPHHRAAARGLPDPLRPEGRAIVRDLLRRRIRIRGLLRHPLRLVRLTKLLSVADAGSLMASPRPPPAANVPTRPDASRRDRPALSTLAPHRSRRARDVGDRARWLRGGGDAARAGRPGGRAGRRRHDPPAPGLGGCASRGGLPPLGVGRDPSRGSSRNSPAATVRSTCWRSPRWVVGRSRWRTCTRVKCSATSSSACP